MTAYDIANDVWITDDLPTLTTPRRTGGGGLIGHKMYVAGGKDSASTILSSCEEFDLDTKTSTSKANMSTAYWAVASAVAGDKLYIIGNESALGTTFEYNPAVDSWKTRATLSVGRGWACAAGADGLVYVMGGSDASSTALSDCWCFDPAANSWTQKANMPGPRIYSTAAAYGDSVIYVIGGSSDGAALADRLVYSYHIAANSWSTEAQKPTSSGWTMANVAGGVIFDAYGSDCVSPTYLTNLNVASVAPTGIEVIDLRHPKAVSSINPSVVHDVTRISYSAALAARTDLGIYDAAGKLVRTLVDGAVESGNRSVVWNRTDDNGKRVAGGTYFYRLSFDGRSVSGKAIVLQ